LELFWGTKGGEFDNALRKNRKKERDEQKGWLNDEPKMGRTFSMI
jgi:hypothetical protein